MDWPLSCNTQGSSPSAGTFSRRPITRRTSTTRRSPEATIRVGRQLAAPPAMPPPAGDENDEMRTQRRLAEAIYEHRLPPGTKLPEFDLCRIFGVTRGVVRKVLNRLADEQLLDLIPNRGAFVARPSVDQTRDV